MKSKFSIAVLAMLCSTACVAQIKLPAIFTSNMVLQQQTYAPIWGKATPNSSVTVTVSWDRQTYSTTAGSDGKWKADLQTPVATMQPQTITIVSGKNKVTLNNVLIGEVWLCSGQSNMEMPVEGWGKVLNYQQEVQQASYPNIRLLQIERSTSVSPLDDCSAWRGGWQVCSPQNIGEFSASGYFFGRELQKELNIPIGLICSSWGGTVAEAWTSTEALMLMPDFVPQLKNIALENEEQLRSNYKSRYAEWETAMKEADKNQSRNVKLWSSPEFEAGDWMTFEAPQSWENFAGNYDGVAWMRKTIDIAQKWEGKTLTLSLGAIDDQDITFFNGTKIGEENAHNAERIYTIDAKLVKKGKAVILIRANDTGGTGGFTSGKDKLYIEPVNMPQERVSLAGDWDFRFATDNPKPVSPDNPNRPTVLYNAMLNPLVPFAFQGAIWYQGESNASRAEQYKTLLPVMINDWRNAWSRTFPFYIVQLANYQKQRTQPVESDWAELREAQMQTLHLENTGIAVTIDIGDADDIHPKNKQEVGRRLALNALALTYGKNIDYSGPVFSDYEILKAAIRVKYNHAEGLKTADGKSPAGFAIAGPDRKFYWADARIEGESIVLSADKVPFPVAVRYAWADNPVCNVTNQSNLPAAPFRTDNW